jgi:hypothetical protein
MRGFDYELWEYHGSSSDNGWGPWCVETGWTNALIAGTLGLRSLNRGILCYDHSSAYIAALKNIQ